MNGARRLTHRLRGFLRLARADAAGHARLAPRRIYILPTGYGVAFGVLLALMLVGAINYSNNLGFLLTFLLAGLGIVAILQTWRNLVGLELAAGRCEPVFAGRPAGFEIRLFNRQRRPRPGLAVRVIGEEAVALDLDADHDATLTLLQTSRARGRMPLGRIRVETRYPLGLLRAWAYVELDAECLVYPAPGERMPAADQPDYRPSPRGDRGVGVDDFNGLRSYRPGDALSSVYWKGMARGQGLHSKLFGGDRAERRWLDWAQLGGDTEQRLRQLTRGVLDAVEEQLEYGLRLPGQQIPPARGAAHRHRCLQLLALYREAR